MIGSREKRVAMACDKGGQGFLVFAGVPEERTESFVRRIGIRFLIRGMRRAAAATR